MPSSLKFIDRKKKPLLGKRKNKIYSRQKKKGNRHVDRRMLDNMLSPVYSVTKKDYGYSTVLDDGGANTGDLPDSGNLSSIQCLPGRQIYLEFLALPARDMTMIASGAGHAPSTYKRTWSFMDLLFGAWKRNRYVNQQSNQVTTPSDFVYTNATDGFNLPTIPGNQNTDEFVASDTVINNTITTEVFVEKVLSNAAYNFKFCYMGGHQTHRFQNTTQLPVHIEIREFTPRSRMSYNFVRRAVNPIGNVNVHKVPGLWQTMYADRCRIENREMTSSDAGGSVYNNLERGLFNEIDDRNFKYMPGMEETNFLWVVGEAMKATIYPGETFTYKMVLPPFSGDSFQFMKNINRKWNALGGGFQSEIQFGTTPTLIPGFTKFAQVRIIGSRAYTKARFADNDLLDPNYVTATSNDAVPSVDIPNSSNNNNRPIMHVATHGPRVTHTVTEHHAIRTFPVFDGRVHIFSDNTANAETGADITRSDQMVFIDALENNEETIAGDNANMY